MINTGYRVHEIYDTGFYIYSDIRGIWIGLELPNGTITSEHKIAEVDWIDWLRDELAQCHTISLPQVFYEGSGMPSTF